MSSSPSNSTLKRAYLALEEMQERVRRLESAQQEPIAVIGMSCRVPGGANSPEALWNLLLNGVDAVTEVPRDRWDVDAYYDPNPDAPGKMSTRWGAFIEGIDQFDADFFGISPREAEAMDPQQRILLELSWEALERAGRVAPGELHGSKTGVFLGVTTNDYAEIHRSNRGLEGVDAYFASGIADSVASGRIAYVLGLTGPAISIDTACSSSLVAIHLACQSIRRGESTMAVAGGVNAVLTPDLSVVFSKYQMMSPEGRCKTFDASANGFVRGEGGVIVVLKKLSDALADGDVIHAVIRGSAINQDGASSGLTAPNGPSQEKVIRAALADAGVSADEVSYVEAHGTGTSLGDPIELQALGAVLGRRDPDHYVPVGSIKTNLGHLEAAAGAVGLLKVVLMLKHRRIPPNLHFHEPNPFIPWSRLPLKVPVSLSEWEGIDGRRIAGVSSFGFSGTNVHVILEEAPASVHDQEVQLSAKPQLLCVSAKSDVALREYAGRIADALKESDFPLRDVAFTLNSGRASLSERVAILAHSTDEAASLLSGIARGDDSAVVARGTVYSSEKPRVGFLFTGQGSQYPSMSRGLYEAYPAYKAALDTCCEIFDGLLDHPLRNVLFAEAGSVEAGLLDQARYTQPALFSIEYSLAELWRSWGVEPTAVIGHSLGEFAAAVVAGALSLEEAASMVAARGRLMHALPEGGAMVAVFAGEERVRPLLKEIGGILEVAAVNGPEHVVVSGPAESVQALKVRLESDGTVVKSLRVSHAFHSAAVDPILSEFEAVCQRTLNSEASHAPRIHWASTVTGQIVRDGAAGTTEYWRQNVRQPVRFLDAMKALEAVGCTVYLEIGPHPVLTSMASEFVSNSGGDVHPVWAASLRRGADEVTTILQSVGRMFAVGVGLDWIRHLQHERPRRVVLPTYPFQRRRYWLEPRPERRLAQAGGPEIHPLLGRRIRTALREAIFESVVSTNRFHFLNDHRLFGQAIMPATGYLAAALAAGSKLTGSTVELSDVALSHALSVDEEHPRLLQVVVVPEQDSSSWAVHSSDPDLEDSWVQHVNGHLATTDAAAGHQGPSLNEIRSRCSEEISGAEHYALFETLGVNMGPSLQGVRRLWKGKNEALGEIVAPSHVQVELGPYAAHPAVLDACMQIIWAARSDGAEVRVHMPIYIERVRVFRPLGSTVLSHATIRQEGQGSAEMFTADFQIMDEEGRLLAEVEGMRMRRVAREALRAMSGTSTQADAFHSVDWIPSPLPTETLSIDLEEATARLTELHRDLSRKHDLEHFDTLKGRSDRLAAMFVLRALDQMGLNLETDEAHELSSLASALRVAPKYQRLFSRLIDLLKSTGDVELLGGQIRFVSGAPESDEVLRAELRSLQEEYPPAEALLILVERCGFMLDGILRGEVDPLQQLFPGGSSDVAERLYSEDPYGHVLYALSIEAVSDLVRAMPPNRTLRVLEVGAGTGGTTSSLVPVLATIAPDRVSYTFTDIGPLFVERAREKYAAYPFMSYATLDVEKRPSEQGFEAGAYDLVVASNVLHATADLREALTNVRELLRPDGHLLVLESTDPVGWIDITFGLTEGWWRFTDFDIRPDYPLVSAATWTSVLKDIGFTATVSVPDGGEVVGADRILLLARNGVDGTRQDSDEPSTWLVFADEGGIGDRVATKLRERGDRCVIARQGASFEHLSDEEIQLPAHDPAAYRAALSTSDSWAGVVHCWPADVTVEEGAEALGTQAFHALGSTHYLTVALASSSLRNVPRLWIVSQGAQNPDSDTGLPSVMQAGLWGYGRALALEHPELRCTLVDLDSTAAAADRLFDELIHDASDDEIVWREHRRYVSRLRPFAPIDGDGSTESVARSLVLPSSGILEDMRVVPVERTEPGPGQVEIRVRATGLNFRDVMNALAMRDDREPVGSEVAGTVTSVGPGVEGIQVGDSVVAIAAGGFSTHVMADATLVVPRPERLSWDEAATIPLAYLTAWYALFKSGSLQSGHRVLIHAGAGGVGIAAFHLAKSAGAEVFATAGSPEKRNYLRQLGAAHVFDSRTPDFSSGVLAVTRGEGVDLVVNSLSGDFIPRSLDVVKEGGCFVEIGKRDIWSADQVREIRPDISYCLLNLLETLKESPATIRPLFLELMERADRGGLPPLPVTRFAFDDVASAFRFMAQARHIGKIVVSQPVAQPVLREDASYLITGGLRGLGLLVADWLADAGAKHLILLGRSAPNDEAIGQIAKLERAGVNVHVVQADVSVRPQLEAALRSVRDAMPPIRGVVHSAGLLEDGAIVTKDWERFSRVLGPKVAGAWHLHQLVGDVDFFVLFSSIASVLGGAGEADHGAANAFMDALARYRRRKGLPATSINWGPWSEVGAAVRYDVSSEGLHMIDPEEGLEYLRTIMTDATPQLMAGRVDWEVFARRNSAHARRPLLSGLFEPVHKEQPASGQKLADSSPTLGQILELPANRRKKSIVEFVIKQAESVLGYGGMQSLNPKKPLNEMGFDSLMSVELRNRLNAGLKLDTSLPATLVFDHPTAESIAEYLLGIISTNGGDTEKEAAMEAGAEDDLESLISSIESLSDDETANWLNERTGREV